MAQHIDTITHAPVSANHGVGHMNKWGEFRIRDIYVPNRSDVALTLFGDRKLRGRIVDVSNNNTADGQYAVVEQGIYFIPPPDPDYRYLLKLLESATGKITEVTALDGDPFYRLSASPDGRSILCTLRYQANSDLMLVENFR